MQRLPLKHATVLYFENFLTKTEADEIFKSICDEIKFEKRPREARPTALYGHAARYKYALNDATPTPWVPVLDSLRMKIARILKETVPSCATISDHDMHNVCLLNRYENGNVIFAAHRDREELGNAIPLASVSIGAERLFMFKYFPFKPYTKPAADEVEKVERQKASEQKQQDEEKKQEKPEELTIKLTHGSLLVMSEGTHENYVHWVPKDTSFKDLRLNLTFRHSRV